MGISLYDLETIKRDVRIVIDESEDNSALLSAIDPITIETDNITEAMIFQSVDEVHKAAQAHMLKDAQNIATLSLITYGRGKVASLPTDFLRFMSAKCYDWARPVFEPIDQDSDEYLQQQSKWAGIRGCQERPVVAIVPSGIGLDMEVYTTDQTSIDLYYIKNAYDDDGRVEIASQCYRAVLYMIAKYYLIATGNAQQAAIMNAIALQMIGAQQTSTEQA